MPKQKNFANKIDWNTPREFYLQNSTIGLKELANKFGLNYGTLRMKASEENWGDLKVQYLHAVDTRLTKIREVQADKQAEIIATKTQERSQSFMFIRQTVIQQLNTKLNQLKVEKDKDGNVIYEETLDTKELEQIARAMKVASEGERLEDGQPITIEKQEVTTRKVDTVFHALGQIEGIIQHRELEKVKKQLNNTSV